MVPVTDDKLIYCRGDMGPWFGAGNPDIGMYDNNKVYCHFPTFYNKQNNPYPNGDKSSILFSGSKGQTSVTEYEVFRVIYK
jgi:hypothetical protein